MRHLTTAFLLLTISAGAMAQTNNWTGGAAGDDNWSTGGNWSTTNPPLTTEIVVFDDTDSGVAVLLDDGSHSIAGLRAIGSNHNQTIDLNANDLTVTGPVGIADASVGAPDASFSDITLSNGGTAQFGEAGAPVDVTIGRHNGADNTNNDGRLSMTGLTFAGYLDEVFVARSDNNGSGRTADGTWDLTGATIGRGGTFEANALNISYSPAGGTGGNDAADGTVSFDDSLARLKINDALRLGFGKSGTATLNLPTTTGLTVQIGDPAGTRADLQIGDKRKQNGRLEAAGTLTDGTFRGAFAAYLDVMNVGTSNGGRVAAATVLDLSHADATIGNGGVLDVNTLSIGWGNGANDTANGTVDLENDSLTMLKINSALQMGRGANTASGTLLLPTSSGLTVQVGDFGNARADIVFGAHLSRGNGDQTVNGTLTDGSFTGTFDSYLDTVVLGLTQRNAGKSSNAIATGRLNLTNATIANGGVFDVNSLRIGTGDGATADGNPRATGELAFGASLDRLNVNTRFEIGGPAGDTSGTLTLPAGARVQIGIDDANRAGFTYGYHDRDKTGDSAVAGTLTDGSYTGTFGAFLTEMLVGVNDGAAGQTTATLDLSAATLTADGLDVSGGLRVGDGLNAVGSLLLPDGDATAATVTVGSDDSGSDGFIQLDGTALTVTGGAGALSVDAGNGEILSIFDSAAPLGTWSIAWEGGDFTSTLDGWLGDGRLSYTFGGSETIGTWYDVGQDTTFFGVVVPEPASAMTILVGLGWIMLRRRPRRSE